MIAAACNSGMLTEVDVFARVVLVHLMPSTPSPNSCSVRKSLSVRLKCSLKAGCATGLRYDNLTGFI